MSDTSNLNTFNVLDKNIKEFTTMLVPFYLTINIFETAIFLFYQINSRPGNTSMGIPATYRTALLSQPQIDGCVGFISFSVCIN